MQNEKATSLLGKVTGIAYHHLVPALVHATYIKKMELSMKRTIVLLAMAGALSTAPAFAQTQHADGYTVSNQLSVSYADLDLSKEDDRKTFNRRLRHAAEDVCGEASGYDLATANTVRACRRMLMERFAAIRTGQTMVHTEMASMSAK
ncbi:MAG: UrcA family protein [Sphingobium sp.]|nr:UrcA family protein [Sphingobium sp.]MCP5399499.1 UrcA family protein [Sphingomonas sp.]